MIPHFCTKIALKMNKFIYYNSLQEIHKTYNVCVIYPIITMLVFINLGAGSIVLGQV